MSFPDRDPGVNSLSTPGGPPDVRTIVRAIENECYVDEHDALQLGVPRGCLIPRPGRYSDFLRHGSARGLARLIRRMWWLSLPILAADFLRGLLARVRLGFRELPGGDSVFIAAEKHAAESMGAFDEVEAVVRANGIVFTSPTIIRSSDPRAVSCLQLFTFGELLETGWHSLRIYCHLARESRDPLFRLHLARVWRATLGCRLMQALTLRGIKTVIHCNHYDTTAVVIHDSFEREIVQIQHGQVRREIVPPCRIRPPAKLYTLDPGAEEIFRLCILSDHNAQFVVEPYRRRLVFAEENSEAFVVLIASRPGDVDAEMRYISALHRRGLDALEIVVKPHPLLSLAQVYSRKFRKSHPVSIWPQRYCFPRPNVVVCGSSTLRTEFEAYGIPVLDVHRADAVDATCDLHSRLATEAPVSALSSRNPGA